MRRLYVHLCLRIGHPLLMRGHRFGQRILAHAYQCDRRWGVLKWSEEPVDINVKTSHG